MLLGPQGSSSNFSTQNENLTDVGTDGAEKTVLSLDNRETGFLPHPGGTSGKEPACECRRLKETWV